MIWFLFATVVLLILTAFHLTAGQKEIVRPLLAARAFAPDQIAVLWLCWHVVTMLMLTAAAAYVAVVISDAYRGFALSATILIGLLALLSLIAQVTRRQRLQDMPQWIAFTLVTLLGIAGELTLPG
jgi:uncharacterized membrane protein (DUF4010 family)